MPETPTFAVQLRRPANRCKLPEDGGMIIGRLAISRGGRALG
jgi:hypothetical protein